MKQATRLLRTFGRHDHGAITLMFALLLPIIVGFIGLGVEVGIWYGAKRSLQTAADAAAISAAYEISAGSSTATIKTAAEADAVRNNYDTSIGTIAVNIPPSSGSYSSNSNAVEVILSETHTMLFGSLIANSTEVTINSRAVVISGGDGDACVLALNTSIAKALEFSGNSTIDTTGCIIASNSSDSSSIEISGNAAVTADSLQTVGDYNTKGASTLTTTSSPVTNASSVSDPYADLTVPFFSGCDETEFKNNPSDTDTITPFSTTTPYVFCDGLDVKGTLYLDPGIYVVDEGTFNINAGATMTGTNVSIILTSSSGANHAKYTMNGHATINLSAPSTGDYAGILMYRDRDASDQDNTLNGSASAVFNGALYFPSSTLKFEGNSSAGGASCTQLIADSIQITGATGITSSGCVSAGATLATISGTELVE